MKWQDSTKVIITQKLHRIRNWEFQNMWNGMCTIEMIENLKIENSTKMWVCAISPYEQRYVGEIPYHPSIYYWPFQWCPVCPDKRGSGSLGPSPRGAWPHSSWPPGPGHHRWTWAGARPPAWSGHPVKRKIKANDLWHLRNVTNIQTWQRHWSTYLHLHEVQIWYRTYELWNIISYMCK